MPNNLSKNKLFNVENNNVKKFKNFLNESNIDNVYLLFYFFREYVLNFVNFSLYR